MTTTSLEAKLSELTVYNTQLANLKAKQEIYKDEIDKGLTALGLTSIDDLDALIESVEQELQEHEQEITAHIAKVKEVLDVK